MASRRRRGLVVTVAVATGVLAPLSVALAAGVSWSSFKPPFRGTTITGFAARSSTDTWAVGLQPGGRCQYQTLTEHWDGSAWKVVASPGVTTVNSVLDGVAVVGSGEAWAVGTVGCPADRSKTLAEHWNGSSWSIVPSPNGGPTGSVFSALHAVSGVATNNVWAVGEQIVQRSGVDTDVPLIEHWNGARWSIVPAPIAAVGALRSVSATSTTDIWAVGASQKNPEATLALHFNGSTWKAVTAPTPPHTHGGLFGVKAVAANNAWAVGDDFPSSGGNGTVLVDHWNGTTWQVSPTPPVGPSNALSGLYSVAAGAGTGVWAVGFMVTDVTAQAVVLHWTGRAWAQETAPNSPSLFAMAVLPDAQLFASDFGTIFLGKFSG